MELIMHNEDDDDINKNILQEGKTLKEIIKEAKSIEETEINTNKIRITYLAIRSGKSLLTIHSYF
jgi:hypothetical protein